MFASQVAITNVARQLWKNTRSKAADRDLLLDVITILTDKLFTLVGFICVYPLPPAR